MESLAGVESYPVPQRIHLRSQLRHFQIRLCGARIRSSTRKNRNHDGGAQLAVMALEGTKILLVVVVFGQQGVLRDQIDLR